MDNLTLNDLLLKVSEYNDDGREIIKRAYDFAEEIHRGQKRQSGEAYIMHPLNVAYILADMARVGKVNSLTPVKGPQKLAIQRLTRHRKHISEQIVKEKLYVLNNIFLKFSAFDRKYEGLSPFSDPFTAIAQAVLLEYKSPEEIINTSIEDLTSFIATI